MGSFIRSNFLGYVEVCLVQKWCRELSFTSVYRDHWPIWGVFRVWVEDDIISLLMSGFTDFCFLHSIVTSLKNHLSVTKVPCSNAMPCKRVVLSSVSAPRKSLHSLIRPNETHQYFCDLWRGIDLQTNNESSFITWPCVIAYRFRQTVQISDSCPFHQLCWCQTVCIPLRKWKLDYQPWTCFGIWHERPNMHFGDVCRVSLMIDSLRCSIDLYQRCCPLRWKLMASVLICSCQRT